MSNIVGSHHILFNQIAGLNKQPAAPMHPPTKEMVAAGFLRRIQEHTVILLTAITIAAKTSSRQAIDQRAEIRVTRGERVAWSFLPSNRYHHPEVGVLECSARSTSHFSLMANCQLLTTGLLAALLRRLRQNL